jgi:vanillate O-demethylase ferredoxin subunit
METSCEQRVCGPCLIGVLEGVPDHRDMLPTDAEKAAGDKMCARGSRSRSEVFLLDL